MGTIPKATASKHTIRSKIDNCKIELTKKAPFVDKELKNEIEKIEFDFVGMDPAIYNTIRRIMIAEVPSMAFERVLIYNNNSVVQDEILAHRLGLVPLKADPRLFKFRNEEEKVDLECTDEKAAHSGKYAPSENDTLKFILNVECKKNKSGISNDIIYTSHIKWVPLGEQENKMAACPVFSDIIINKLRPRQGMDIELYAHKGIGKDHAKFSPVCTAFYRLLPTIKLLKTFTGEDAQKLQACFSPGVISIIDNKAVVDDPRKDACTRENQRHEQFQYSVELGRCREHALFSIETVGALSPSEIFIESLRVLRSKCEILLKEIDNTAENDRPSVKTESN